jgi:hypothetical protein
MSACNVCGKCPCYEHERRTVSRAELARLRAERDGLRARLEIMRAERDEWRAKALANNPAGH